MAATQLRGASNHRMDLRTRQGLTNGTCRMAGDGVPFSSQATESCDFRPIDFCVLRARAKIGQKFWAALSEAQTKRPCFQGLSSSGGRI